MSRYDIQSELPKLKLNSDTVWLRDVNSQSLQATLLHLETAYNKFFRKSGWFPKFKSKKSKQSFELPSNVRVDFDTGVIKIPKVKDPIKCIFHRKFEGDVRTCHITCTKAGNYYISILVDDGNRLPNKPPVTISTATGIDVGIKNFLITSDGNVVNNPRHFLSSHQKLKRLQRSFSRKMRGLRQGESSSVNAEKTKNKLQKLHEHVANQRKDFLHKISTKLIRENQTICIEDLCIKDMMKNKYLSNSISDVGWGMFFDMLEYKSEWYGTNLLTIGRFDPSSKTCSNCGHIKHDLKLSDREWTCTSCNSLHDRDVNAAINIRDFAFVGRRDSSEVKPVRYGTSLEASAGN
jgi:putative transposase